jgi:hypothetical protein
MLCGTSNSDRNPNADFDKPYRMQKKTRSIAANGTGPACRASTAGPMLIATKK